MLITKRNCSAKLLLYFLLVTPGLLLIIEPAWAQHTITVHSDISMTENGSGFGVGRVTTNNTINWDGWGTMIIEITSLSADLGDSDDLSYTKPLSDFLWKRSATGTWTAITTSFVTVWVKSTPGPAQGSFGMDYKILLDWAVDKPGSYTTNLQYQITST